MTREQEIKIIKNRIEILESRPTDNRSIIKKLERKIRRLTEKV